MSSSLYMPSSSPHLFTAWKTFLDTVTPLIEAQSFDVEASKKSADALNQAAVQYRDEIFMSARGLYRDDSEV